MIAAQEDQEQSFNSFHRLKDLCLEGRPFKKTYHEGGQGMALQREQGSHSAEEAEYNQTLGSIKTRKSCQAQ